MTMMTMALDQCTSNTQAPFLAWQQPHWPHNHIGSLTITLATQSHWREQSPLHGLARANGPNGCHSFHFNAGHGDIVYKLCKGLAFNIGRQLCPCELMAGVIVLHPQAIEVLHAAAPFNGKG